MPNEDRGGWNKYVLMWKWYDLQLRDYPGWELEKGKPLSVDLTIVKGRDKSSRNLAIEFDDIAEGGFYYRDWTESGLPYVDDGDIYRSAFWFQFRSDWIKFKNITKDYGINSSL